MQTILEKQIKAEGKRKEDLGREAFKRLHEPGLIYRGEYLVNWCPASGSAVSHLEAEMKEVDGHLWHFRHPLAGDSGPDGRTHLEVATTRPETLLGDTPIRWCSSRTPTRSTPGSPAVCGPSPPSAGPMQARPICGAVPPPACG